jgi:hypothetical protein
VVVLLQRLPACVVPVHCAELHVPEELPEEVVVVVVVVGFGCGCGNGSFSQETNNIAVNTVVIISIFFIVQSNK